MYPSPPPIVIQQQPAQQPAQSKSFLSNFLGDNMNVNDLRMVALVVVLVCVVQIVPIEVFVEKYIPAVASFPQSRTIIKAVAAGLLFMVISKHL
jgi:hypothetical protein